MSARCGTVGGYRRHRRQGETPCPECKKANAAYMRDLRARTPALRSYDSRQKTAYLRAEQRLREAHDAEFKRYYAEERRAVGLSMMLRGAS